jgi:hypothetical protein
LWHEAPERREIDDDPIVEIGIPERGDVFHLVFRRW